MIYNLYINQKMCEDEKLSFNAVLIFGVLKQLMVLTYVHKKIYDNATYFILHRNYILEQIPFASIKTRTLTDALTELKEAGMILSDDARKNPAYAFTSKADKYISSIKTNDAEQKEDKERAKPLFELPKMTAIVNISPEYYQLLEKHCLGMCKTKKIPTVEFDNFIAHHGSKGTKFKNYIMAFATWCANYKKFNPQTNGGDKDNGYLNS
ncbi:MAG: hypothetical protein Q9M40_07185 [Sulfurimonas sp.]|nr:hypothetical protein [Sulfurimonas sp.]